MESKSVKKADMINILKFILKKWLIVILVGVLGAGTIGGYEYFQYKVQKKNELFANANRIDPVYGSFVVYVSKFDDSDNYYNRIEDVTAIAKGYTALNEIIDKNKLPVDYTKMINCVTAVTVGINQIEISVEGSLIGLDQTKTLEVTRNLCDTLMKTYEDKFGKGSVVLIDEPHERAYVLEKSMTVDDDKAKIITKKSVVKKGIIGGMAGCVAGVIILIFYVLNSTLLRTFDEVVSCFGMRLLGTPDRERLDKEEYRRTAGLMRKAVTAFVSFTDAEGRSSVVEKLADTVAVNGNTSVIVKISGQVEKQTNPLLAYETGNMGIDKMIQQTQTKGVSLVEWTEASAEGVDLFTNEKLSEALKELSDRFDYVFVDCPAFNISASGLYLCMAATQVVVMAGKDAVREQDVARLKQSFANNNIESLGLIYIK